VANNFFLQVIHYLTAGKNWKKKIKHFHGNVVKSMMTTCNEVEAISPLLW